MTTLNSIAEVQYYQALSYLGGDCIAVQYSTVQVAMAALKITSLHCARLLSCPISRIWAAIFSDRNLPLGMLMVAI